MRQHVARFITMHRLGFNLKIQKYSKEYLNQEYSSQIILFDFLTLFGIVLFSFVILFPFYMMLITSFKTHIEASIDLNIPIIVHSRNAEKETYDILNVYKDQKPKILMHCFTGSYNFYKKMEELDSFFSASGIITFNNSKELQLTFSKIPNEKLLVETDSPFLAPVPMRGKKNEPSYIKYTVQKLAEIKNIETSEIINITTKNFEKLFFSI